METATGVRRLVLSTTERISAVCADSVQCNGESLRKQFVEFGFASFDKLFVPASGSSNGIEAGRFLADPAFRAQERARRGIPADAVVLGFAGRFTRDKGIEELSRVFDAIAARRPDVWLLLVGDFDETDPLPASVRTFTRDHPRVAITGMLADPAKYYSVMDIAVFPSHREGFPNVPMEAAAAGLPVVGYRATGTVDAVVDGVTGELVPLGDEAALERALERYLADPTLRAAHGRAGKDRVCRDFVPAVVWEAIAREYGRLLAERGIAEPVAVPVAITPEQRAVGDRR
jgi:glycosyltransferase involved in cell wall biosynthesis